MNNHSDKNKKETEENKIKNKSLYDEILNLSEDDTAELQDHSITQSYTSCEAGVTFLGYSDGAGCSTRIEYGQFDDDGIFIERGLATRFVAYSVTEVNNCEGGLVSSTVSPVTAVIRSGSIPPFMIVNEYVSDNQYVHETWWPTGEVSFENYATLDDTNSTSEGGDCKEWRASFGLNGPPCGAGVDCHGSGYQWDYPNTFNWVNLCWKLCDKNEAPLRIDVSSSHGVCYDRGSRALFKNLSTTDLDTLEHSFRRHRYTLTGPDAASFEIDNVNTGSNPSSASIYALPPFNWGGRKEVSVIVTDMGGNGFSVTGGPYYLSIYNPTEIQIDTLCSANEIPDDTPVGAIVGYIQASDPNLHGTCQIVNQHDSFSNIDPDGVEHAGLGGSKNYLQVQGVGTKLNHALPIIFVTGLASQPDEPATVSITGHYQRFGATIGVDPDICCGASGSLRDTRTTVSILYDTFLTGVGPDVPFTGGVGNVEETYIQFANSQQSKLAIFPASSGGGSQDEYFYIYDVGQIGLSGVAPPSSGLQIQNAICYTGVSNNPRILIHYNDTGNNNNIFYNYSVTGDSFSAETFVTSGLHQIVKPKLAYTGIGVMTAESRYAVILASGEAFIYDPYLASGTGLDYNLGFNITGQVAALGSVSNADFSSTHPLTTSQWVQIGERIIGEAANDQFGRAVAINSTGNIIAATAPSNDGPGEAAQNPAYGHVRVYSFSGSSWSQLGQEIDGEFAGDNLGKDVAINSTGNIVAISCGAAERPVRVYQLSEAFAWVQLGNDITGDSTVGLDETDKQWGYSLDLNSDGSRVALGHLYSEHVRVYDLVGSTWTQAGGDIDGESTGDLFGFSVAINSSGNRVVVGAPNNDGNGLQAGSVRAYELVGSTWTQLGSDIDSGVPGDNSGWDVDIDSDGDRIVIGAPSNGAGHARVYEYSGSSWVQLGNNIDGEAANDQFGLSVSINSAGDRIAVGALNNDDGGLGAGSIRVFDWSGSAWTQVEQDIDGGNAGDQLGGSVALNSVGDRVVGGADLDGTSSLINEGVVYVFNRGRDGHGQAGQSKGEFTIFPLGSYEPAEFDYPLIISGIGEHIAYTSGASINSGFFAANGAGGLSGILHSYNNGNDYDILETPNYYIFGMQHTPGNIDPGGALYFYDKTPVHGNPSSSGLSIYGYASPGDGVDRRRLFTLDFNPQVNNHCYIEVAFCSYSATGSHQVFFHSSMTASGYASSSNDWYHLDDNNATLIAGTNSLFNGSMSGVVERVVKISPNPENSRNRTQTFLLGENGSSGTIFDHYSRAYEGGPFAWQPEGGPTVLTFSSGTGVNSNTPYNIGQYSNIISTNGIVFATPKYTYDVFPSGNLIGFSPNTTAASGIQLFDTTGGLTSQFYADETVISFAPSQTTTGEIFLGTFSVQDDEFNGGLSIGFASDLGDDIFVAKNIGNGTGEIYLKSGVILDYEDPNQTLPTYTGFISGVDPFIGGVPFVDQFTLEVVDVQEEPTGLSLDPVQGSVSENHVFTDHLKVSTIQILDPDIHQSGGFENVISLSGPDANDFFVSGTYQGPATQITESGLLVDLLLKSNVSLSREAQPQHQVTVLVQQVGGTIRAAETFFLNVFDDPPTGVSIVPSSTSILESLVFSTSTFKLADFTLLDPDTFSNNTVQLLGPDAGFFTATYNASTNSGELSLNQNVVLDFETKPIITGLIGAKQLGAVEASATGTFIINLIDVSEPSGITISPQAFYIDEGTVAQDTFLGTLTFTDTSIHTGIMTLTNIQESTGTWRDLIDRFYIEDNQTTSPDLYVAQNVVFDYETKGRYDIVLSGFHENESDGNQYGVLFRLFIRDVDEPPVITLDPTGFTISEHTDMSLDHVFVSRILCEDENQQGVSIQLEGADRDNFVVSGVDIAQSIPGSSIHIGNLFVKSGTALSFLSKPIHTVNVIGFDSVHRGTGVFTLNVDESDICHIDISGGTTTNTTCFASNDGIINLGTVEFTGTNSNSCFSENTIIVEWDNLPSEAIVTPDNRFINNLPTGTYVARFYSSGNSPNVVPQLSKVEPYTIDAPPQLSIVQVIQDSNECLATGSMSVTVTGGTPPYTINYAQFSVTTTGSQTTATISDIVSNTSGILTIADSNNCLVSGQSFEYQFNVLDQEYVFESQTEPEVYDGFLSSYKFNVNNGSGPYDINIYNSISGEKGQLYTSIDRYDTSVLSSRLDEYDRIVYDSSGVPSVLSASQELERKRYFYDIGSKLYPGSYVFEFVNTIGCSLLSPVQTASNSLPLNVNLQINNDTATDIAFDVEIDQSLNALFIPYNMIKRDSDLLSFLSNITHNTDVKIQVGDKIYSRRPLEATLTCDNISQLNITFLGMKPTEWFYVFPIFKGFSLDDTSIDIVNENIYLVLPNKKIKIITKFNNNTRSIKLLRGGRILTTSTNVNQFVPNALLQLNTFSLTTGDFETIAEGIIIHSTKILHNKYIAGRTFSIDVLNNTNVSQFISTADVNVIEFDCNAQQRHILNYKKFIEEINNFERTFLYIKRSNYVINGGSIGLYIDGGNPNPIPPEYDITYKYYDKDSKQLLSVTSNGQEVKETSLNSLPAGTYTIRIQDKSSNIIRTVNSAAYDNFYSSQIDYINNDLNATTGLLDFRYGDLLAVVYNANDFTGETPPSNIPGIDPPSPPTGTPTTLPAVQTETIEVSPNTSLNNSLTVLSQPVLTTYVITGPLGFRKTLNQRTVLTQIPPGVYDIVGQKEDLDSKFLRQDGRCIKVTETSKELVILNFVSYADRIVIGGDINNTINSRSVSSNYSGPGSSSSSSSSY